MLKKLNLLWLGAGVIVILSAAGCGGNSTNEEPASPESRQQGSPPVGQR